MNKTDYTLRWHLSRGGIHEAASEQSVLLGNLGSWHSCECYFDMHHIPKDFCRPRTPLMKMDPAMLHKIFGGLGLQVSIRLSTYCMGCSGPTNPIHGGPTFYIAGPKGGCYIMSWCQRPQDIFRCLMESMPSHIRAVLAAQGGPT